MSSAVCLLNKMTPYEFFERHLSHQEAVFTIPSVVHYPDHNESTRQYRHSIMCISWVKSSYSYVRCPTKRGAPRSRRSFLFRSNGPLHTYRRIYFKYIWAKAKPSFSSFCPLLCQYELLGSFHFGPRRSYA